MAAYLSAELLQKYFLLINTVVVITFNTMAIVEVEGATTTWCVARSDATAQALQTALDYACASGADCTPLQSDGLCFLPNTIQAHASYAFNSYYQRKSMAPGSCDFSGTATIAQTDPSYGSCMYPSSLSTAGGTTPTTTSINSPNTPIPTTTTPYGNGGAGGLTPGLTPTTPFPDTDNSKASMDFKFPSNIMAIISCLVVLTITLKPMLYVFLLS